MYDDHKAMQGLPADLRQKVHWRTLRSSRLRLCMVGFYLAWAVACPILILLDRTFALTIASLVVVISLYPFQLIAPRRRLATTFQELNIRPSHCGYCEYDLHGTVGDACPECGTTLAPERTPGEG